MRLIRSTDLASCHLGGPLAAKRAIQFPDGDRAGRRPQQSQLILTQLLTHHIQGLPQREVERPVHRAVGLFVPELPTPATVVTLTLVVDAVLAEQHDNAPEHPDHPVVEYRVRDPLLTAEVVRQCLTLSRSSR